MNYLHLFWKVFGESSSDGVGFQGRTLLSPVETLTFREALYMIAERLYNDYFKEMENIVEIGKHPQEFFLNLEGTMQSILNLYS